MSLTPDLEERCGLPALLAKYPGLAVRPGRGGQLRLIGLLTFDADGGRGLPRITEAFQLEIVLGPEFPVAVPQAFERGGRIPADYHHHLGGALCLGSDLTLRLILRRDPSLLGFVERAVIPYLYRWSHIQQFGNAPWGELDHDRPGLIEELGHLFNTSEPDVMQALLGLSRLRRRVANKHPCPCRSGRRLGRCHHRQVNYLRRIQRDFHNEVQANRARVAAQESMIAARPAGASARHAERDHEPAASGLSGSPASAV